MVEQEVYEADDQQEDPFARTRWGENGASSVRESGPTFPVLEIAQHCEDEASPGRLFVAGDTGSMSGRRKEWRYHDAQIFDDDPRRLVSRGSAD